MALGKVAAAEPRHENQAPLMNPYRAGDGRWFFITGLETERHLPGLLRALDRADLLEDARFENARAIRRNRTEVIALLDELFAERSLDEWTERFDREGVWWAPAQTPAQVLEDPQFVDNGGLLEVDGGLRSVNGPVSFSGVDRPSGVRVPGLGEHTDEVLAAVMENRSAPG
jgi:crotonobetainyl-CoA:carnitine CoA-transferase CaiB-like acyl-CoA transferase